MYIGLYKTPNKALSCLVLFWLNCASDLSSFWKTATQRYGGFGEFTLVQGSKIQLNQLWYRLRVPVSQPQIPTQKFLKYPPPPPSRPGLEITSRIQESRFSWQSGRWRLRIKCRTFARTPPPTPLSVLTLIPALFINRAMTCDVCSVPANFMFLFSLYQISCTYLMI